MSFSHLYSRLLLPRLHGYPLFRPQPFDDLPLESKQRGTDIGDVGVVTSDGSFDVIFNIRLAGNDPRNRFGVPDGFERVYIKEEDLRRSSPHFPGSDVSNTKISKRRLDVNAGTESNVQVFVPLGAGAVIEISTSSKEAAVLLLPEGASRCDLRCIQQFRDYALKHAHQWYAFVNEDLKRMVGSGDLYLVTGVDKSMSWSIAAVENHTEDCTISLKLKAAQVGSAGVACAWEWESSSESTHSGPRGLPDAQLRTENQTVFLRGFKVAIRASLLQRSPKVVWIADSKPSEILFKSSFIPFSEPASNTKNSLSSRAGGRPSAGTCDSNDDDDLNFDFNDPPARSDPHHPADALNKYLLSSSDVDVAVTHDNDWAALLRQDEDDVPGDSELVERMIARSAVYPEIDGTLVPAAPWQRKVLPDSRTALGPVSTRYPLPPSYFSLDPAAVERPSKESVFITNTRGLFRSARRALVVASAWFGGPGLTSLDESSRGQEMDILSLDGRRIVSLRSAPCASKK